MNIKVEQKEEKLQIYTPYNKNFVSDLKQSVSTAKWSGSCWEVSIEAKELIDGLLKEHYGYNPGQPKVKIEITAKEEIEEMTGSVNFAGCPVAYARGRDTGAKVCDGIIKMSGNIRSGGSARYYKTIVEKGATFRLETYKNIIDEKTYDESIWDVKTLSESIDREALLSEKEQLLKRLNEIEKQLQSN